MNTPNLDAVEETNLGGLAFCRLKFRDGDPGFAGSYAEASTPSLPKIKLSRSYADKLLVIEW